MKAIKFVPIFAVAFLSACGGGGDSGSSSGAAANTSSGSTSTAAASTSIKINSSNATDVSAYSYAAMEDVNSASGYGSSAAFATGVSVDTMSTGVLQRALQQLYLGLGASANTQLASGVSTTNTVACSGGGSMTLSINVANPNQVQSGDSVSMSAHNCVESSGLVNGGVSIVFSNVSGTISDMGAWSASMTMTYSSFSVLTGGASISANGDMTVSYSQTNANTFNAQMSGTSFAANLTKSDSTQIQRTLTNYRLVASAQNGATSFSGDFGLSGNSPTLGNVGFTVKTTAPFKTAAGAMNPYTGSATVTAADGSSTSYTALDSSNVRIDVDSNGDGVIDSTTNSTWATFRSRI
ncbi:hypothetical protein [Noviherbaspirillum pedocola]|uniref:Uncharacterized protein n=1 Tax=Noviherbaspirillum pedocola TaxID=2801341 RepID=A0A934SR75_9BURK|nr:hypothetical protein [Noviherbaspirillum pedocola]MBK4735090.1 hypothetical protein [Noviherbaspirillum pedocola]